MRSATSSFLAMPQAKVEARRRQGEVSRGGGVRELLVDVAVAQDRPGDGAREQPDEGRVADDAVRGLDVAAVDVDDVRDGAERVERDAERQDHAERGEGPPAAEQSAQAVERVEEEAAVLEVAEEREVCRDGRRQEQLAAAAGALPGLALRQVVPGDPVHEGGRQEQRHVPPVPQPVEEQRRGDEKQEPRVAARDQPVEDDHDRQEDQQEGVAVEEHAAGPSCRSPAA